MLLQIADGRPSFHREVEQANLLAQLRKTPDHTMLVLGPVSSGKTRLLRWVLLSDRLDTSVSWFSGKDLSDASVMTWSLTLALAAQLTALEKVKQGLSAVVQSTIKAKLGIDFNTQEVNDTRRFVLDGLYDAEAATACASYKPSSMNRLIGAFKILLALKKEYSALPPVICIDGAHVLMEWYAGETDLRALLNFFVQVGRSACCCTIVPVISICFWRVLIHADHHRGATCPCHP